MGALILEERKGGRAVMFASHILSDVEMLCDRVAIMNRGEVVAYGALDELLRREIRAVEIELARCDDAVSERTKALPSTSMGRLHDHALVTVHGEAEAQAVLAAALEGKAHVVSVTPRRETLEDLFVRKAIGATASERATA